MENVDFVKCPECGDKIPLNTNVCPNCKYVLARESEKSKANKKVPQIKTNKEARKYSSKKKKQIKDEIEIILLVALLFLFGCAGMFLGYYLRNAGNIFFVFGCIFASLSGFLFLVALFHWKLNS